MAQIIERLTNALTDRYKIERELGAGGMATVYLAEDLKHKRKVAIKTIRPELAAAIGSDRFLQEIEVTANLQHPHILPLYDSGEVDSLVYYVMPFVAGESLRDRLIREATLTIEDALSVTKDVAAALTYAHGHGVVHRDIKPENVLLEDGEARVADFGIALAVASAERERLTATGLSLGTPAYMSPEQIGGEPTIDGRSDVYALGCLLYEMLTGQPPFTGPNVQAVVAAALADPPPSARDSRPDVPSAVDAAITRALAKRPEERFASAREFLEACAIEATAPPRPRTARFGLALVAVVAIVAIVFSWRTIRMSNARESLNRVATLIAEGEFVAAYELAVSAERLLGDDTTLAIMMAATSDLLTVITEPAGALVFVQAHSEGSGIAADSHLVGETPIEAHRIPRVDHRVFIQFDGFHPAERIATSALSRDELPNASTTREIRLTVPLKRVDEQPPDMVFVPGGTYGMVSPDVPTGLSAELSDYWIDRTEVTNAAYREFVAEGGYTKRVYWPDLPEALHSTLVDRTGLTGPRDWVGQAFPDGGDRHPVAGVTWFEAAAYCAYRSKRLPTAYEWEKTARDGAMSHHGVLMPWGFMSSVGTTVRRANFRGTGSTPVDAFPFGISPYGAYAMAGNVKEWVANPMGEGFAVTGGSWEDPAYLYPEVGSQPPSFASAALGFRCARTVDESDATQGAGRIHVEQQTPTYTAVSRAEFQSLVAHYRYDPRPANARVGQTRETDGWTREQIWIDGVAGDSILLFFYTPAGVAPPFQTMIFVPGSDAFCCQALNEIVEWTIGPSIRAGRAVLAVALKGMVGRRWEPGYSPPAPPSVQFRDGMVRHATELRLGMDYLETRADVDSDRLAYVAVSFGAGSRLSFAAVDDRYKAVVLIGGGIDERMKPTLPEADNVNFAPFIDVPKVLINGRHDEEHPWITRALPLWNLLSEPKELVLVDGAGHIPPLEARIPAINDFLDKTLGPVRRTP